MKHIICSTVMILLLAGYVRSQDPAVTDPDKYKVIFENDKVRVLDYQDKPGDKSAMHHHLDSVLYSLGTFTRKQTLENGKMMRKTFKPGDCLFLKEHSHIGENIGDTPSHLLWIELKKPAESPETQTKGGMENKKP